MDKFKLKFYNENTIKYLQPYCFKRIDFKIPDYLKYSCDLRSSKSINFHNMFMEVKCEIIFNKYKESLQ